MDFTEIADMFIEQLPKVFESGNRTLISFAIDFLKRQQTATKINYMDMDPNKPIDESIKEIPIPIQLLEKELNKPKNFRTDFIALDGKCCLMIVYKKFLITLVVGPLGILVYEGSFNIPETLLKNKQQNIEETFDCCICLEEYNNVSWKCKVCKSGIICGKCKKKMGKIHKCPV